MHWTTTVVNMFTWHVLRNKIRKYEQVTDKDEMKRDEEKDTTLICKYFTCAQKSRNNQAKPSYGGDQIRQS